MVDKVKPLKIENPSTGGTQTDVFPTETNPAQDYVATKGIAFEGSDAHLIDRAADGELEYTDSLATTPKKFNQIAGAARYSLPFSYDGGRAVGQFLDVFNGVTSSGGGHAIPKASTITDISVGTLAASTCTIQLLKNGVAITGAVVSLAAAKAGSTTGLSLALAANDQLSAEVTSGSVTRPMVNVFIQNN